MLRLNHITFACEDNQRLARFWGDVLGREVVLGPGDETPALPDSRGEGPELFFIDMPKSPTIEVPIHLDVNVPDREAEVQRLLGLGARIVATKTSAVGDFSETITVMRDPEGNGFCVQGPDRRKPYPYIRNLTFACAEPVRLAEFWSAALGWVREDVGEDFLQQLRDAGLDEREFDAYAALEQPDGSLFRFLFQRRQKTPTESIPLHADFNTDDREAELERLVGLGASVKESKHAGAHTWTVMRDPEGNSFCVE